MCENTMITLAWVNKGKKYSKKVLKNDMLVVFQGLAQGFSDDNEVSIALLDIIKKADELRLNKDIMQSQDAPFIVYNISGVVDMLRIRRRHKIVWAILCRFFSE